jgi:hypothetical protein
MKTARPLFFALAALAVGGCATVDSRIAQHRNWFDSWPPAVQQKVRARQVGLGFTPVQVAMALGEPDREYVRLTAQGESEVWAYRSHVPVVGLGLGVGAAGGSSAYGAGLGVATGGDRSDDKLRVIFTDGQVTTIERGAAK